MNKIENDQNSNNNENKDK